MVEFAAREAGAGLDGWLGTLGVARHLPDPPGMLPAVARAVLAALGRHAAPGSPCRLSTVPCDCQPGDVHLRLEIGTGRGGPPRVLEVSLGPPL